MRRNYLITGVVLLALLSGVWVWGATAAHATNPPHYTDGSTFQGSTNYGRPPTDPRFDPSQNCKADIIDPPLHTVVFVTEHFVYGPKPPPTVPVHDQASLVIPYAGHPPNLFTVDVSAFVAGKDGWRADTWNIGTGVTAWVPFACHAKTTTTTSTTVPQSTSTSTTSTTIGTTPPISTPPVTTPVVTVPPASPVVAQPNTTG